jgi:hypothetical protein
MHQDTLQNTLLYPKETDFAKLPIFGRNKHTNCAWFTWVCPFRNYALHDIADQAILANKGEQCNQNIGYHKVRLTSAAVCTPDLMFPLT